MKARVVPTGVVLEAENEAEALIIRALQEAKPKIGNSGAYSCLLVVEPRPLEPRLLGAFP